MTPTVPTAVHEQGLVALAALPASPTLAKAANSAISVGVSIFSILEAIYTHRDDVVAAYNAIVALYNNVIKPVTPPS